MKLSINILFFLFKSKRSANGSSPLYCRISYQGNRKQFSTGIKIPIINWEHKKQRVKNNSFSSTLYNQILQDLRIKIATIHNEIISEGEILSLNLVSERLNSIDESKINTLLKAYAYKEERMNKLLGIDFQSSTIKKFKEVRFHVESFLLEEKKLKDISLTKLDLKFIIEFEDYLKVVKKQKAITINKIIQRLKSVIKICY